jgi:hypothetical protein
MRGSVYRVVVAGELGPRFADAFDGMEVVSLAGQTEITGVVADRAQLRALLNRIDDLGLTLIEVGVRDEPAATGPSESPH